MDIKMKLYQPFVSCWNKLKEKYGEEFEKINGFHDNNLNFTDFIDNFVDTGTVADATIDANANSCTKDIRTLMSDMTKPHSKLLSANKIFYEITKKYGLQTAQKWLEGEWVGESYLHDFPTASFMPYCFAYDLDEIVEKGLFFIEKFKTRPAKHLTTFNDHILEFISWAANRQSGAVGLPSYLIYSFYFWKKDVENGYYLKDPITYRNQCWQKFIHDLNQPYLRITEAAFTNISVFDREYLMGLFGDRVFPDGTYVVEYIEEIIEYQKAFMEEVSRIRNELMMTFPVLTISLLYQENKFVDEEFARWANKHNMEWCDSNFFVGEDVTTLSNCCRLLSSTEGLKGFINSIGGTSLKIGSIKVNTINLRNIALTVNGEKDKFLETLKERVDTCVKTLDIIRGILKRNMEKGLLPNYTHKLMEFDKQYNTIGITALYEAIKEFDLVETDAFGNVRYSDEGLEFAKTILEKINEYKDSYDFDYSINIESVPAETCNVKLAYKDSVLFPNNESFYIYSNQWIPLTEKCSLEEKIRLGSVLDKACNGGVISHINIQGQFATEDQAWDLLNLIASKGLIYFAYNKEISVCSEEHAFFGDSCPTCGGKKVDTYMRIVGFLTPISSYSKERKREAKERKWFLLE